MKKLLPFLLALSAGFALGNRRARKRGPIDQIMVEIKADTSQAVSALNELSKTAQRTTVHLETAVCRGGDLAALVNLDTYRNRRTV